MEKQYFKFTGSGGEYFKIWIVNLLLTILTLGIYSAWAKVRRNQYFYRNTWLNNSSFNYHASPLAILKGRVLAVILFIVYSQSQVISLPVHFVALALIIVILPWLIQRSLMFKLHNSSYNALRFRFDGNIKEAYITFLLWPALTLFTAYLLTPLTHKKIKEYQHGNSCYGSARFSFSATGYEFYSIYIKTIGINIVTIILIVGLFMMHADNSDKSLFLLIAVVYVAIIALLIFNVSYFSSRIHNLIWNNTQLEGFRINSQLKARSLAYIHLTNLLGILLTLGLYKPYAEVRIIKYKLENMLLKANSKKLQQFVMNQAQTPVSSFGEGVADIFDIDISL